MSITCLNSSKAAMRLWVEVDIGKNIEKLKKRRKRNE